MALVVKTGKYSFLKNLGVSDGWLASLSSANIKFALGEKDFSLISPDNVTLFKGSLPESALDLVNGHVSQSVKEMTKVILTNAVKKALNDLTVDGLTPKVDEPKIDKSNPSNDVSSPGHLRNATSLHQPVRGTSDESVYVVVALSHYAKVAAKIKNSKLSVRVEGPGGQLAEGIMQQFVAQGLQSKDGYMSGHFNCAHVAIPRVLGAILLGSGLSYSTPFPDIGKVKELSK